jgi:hypothetical protein
MFLNGTQSFASCMCFYSQISVVNSFGCVRKDYCSLMRLWRNEWFILLQPYAFRSYFGLRCESNASKYEETADSQPNPSRRNPSQCWRNPLTWSTIFQFFWQRMRLNNIGTSCQKETGIGEWRINIVRKGHLVITWCEWRKKLKK